MKQSSVSHHFLGMLITKWCLVRDVKDRDGTLSSICKASRAAWEQLLWAVLKDIYRVPLRTQHRERTKVDRSITKEDG